jgi:hypothetical protein
MIMTDHDNGYLNEMCYFMHHARPFQMGIHTEIPTRGNQGHQELAYEDRSCCSAWCWSLTKHSTREILTKHSMREALVKQDLAVRHGVGNDETVQWALKHWEWMPHAGTPGGPRDDEPMTTLFGLVLVMA